MFVWLKHLLMIKTGILGTSETAQQFAEILKKSDKYELTGCCSPDYSKTKAFAAQFELVAYPTVEALFKYTDALIITDFSPDFISSSEKSLKNFKHILITNPFLAGIEEIGYLRKLSEESRVIFQIAGNFHYQSLLASQSIDASFFADLRHTFKEGSNICTGFKFMEFLLYDISLLLFLLKGAPKKISTAAWDMKGNNPDLMSARLELDNGHTANILLSQVEDVNSFSLSAYHKNGVSKYYLDTNIHDAGTLTKNAIEAELKHFDASIEAPNLAQYQNETVFQALELVHSIKEKAVRFFTSNIQV